MREVNLSDFLEHRPVYTLDLIGEPVLSTEGVTTRTIQYYNNKGILKAKRYELGYGVYSIIKFNHSPNRKTESLLFP